LLFNVKNAEVCTSSIILGYNEFPLEIKDKLRAGSGSVTALSEFLKANCRYLQIAKSYI